MADRRPPAPKPPTACKPPVVQATLTAPPAQKEQDAVQHVQKIPVHRDPVQPPTPPTQVPNPVQHQLNWSYFKPEFSGKPEEDAETHLLRTNDWMETQSIQEVARVQRFIFPYT